VKGAGLQRVNSRPETCSLHPMAIEVDCFLRNEKAQFSKDFPASSRAAPVPLLGGALRPVCLN
jgi:hypothetical protein